MAKIEIKALKGLRGLGDISRAEREKFLSDHSAALSQYLSDPMKYKIAANRMYENQKFINNFGQAAFDRLHDGTEASYNMRNSLTFAKLRGEADDEINKIFIKQYSPFENPFDPTSKRDNNKGLGADWEKYYQLSPDAKLELLQSGYLTPTELNKKLSDSTKGIDNFEKTIQNSKILKGLRFLNDQLTFGSSATSREIRDAVINGIKQHESEKNDNIIQNIYNKDLKNRTGELDGAVEQVYDSPEITSMNDKQVVTAFKKAVTPSNTNLGIPEYAARLNSPEMEGFSIDDMRRVLAKKKVYDSMMSPYESMTALNNEAKEYTANNQSALRSGMLHSKELLVGMLSYAADGVNSIASYIKWGQDQLMEHPTVMMDDNNNVLDPHKTKVQRDGKGNMFYKDANGQIHSVHNVQISYSALHDMGKNTDGSDIEGAFSSDLLTTNPQYWNNAERYNTLDAKEQKQYAKLGISPYEVAYKPGESAGLAWETTKMLQFGFTDTLLALIPFGIGRVGKVLSTASKAGKIVRGFGKMVDTTGRFLSQESGFGRNVQRMMSAGAIANAYSRGAFPETLEKNLSNLDETVNIKSQNEVSNRYKTDKKYKAAIDDLIKSEAERLQQNYLKNFMAQKVTPSQSELATLSNRCYEEARNSVIGQEIQNTIKKNKSSKEYAQLQQKAVEGAKDAAFNTLWTESLKYAYVNTAGYRSYLFKNATGINQKVSSALKGMKEVTTSAGKKRLATEATKFLTTKDKWKQFGKSAASQFWGGAWTNGTDDMQVDAAEMMNNDSFNRYLDNYQNGKALADTYGFADGINSYLKGLGNSLGQESTWHSGLVGGLGGTMNFSPHFTNIAKLATKSGREEYKNNFRREVVRDDKGMPVRNEDGSIKYKELGKWNDWRGQAAYLIQNGILNDYYGKKQSERDLQNHADYVNNLLDHYDDFKGIEHLIASNMVGENYDNIGDKKTGDFLKAINAINTLESLGNDKSDPAKMFSVVQNAKALIEKAAILRDKGEDTFTDEEKKNLLTEWYAANPGVAQSEENNQKALYSIAENASKLKEAADAYNEAEKEVQKIEKSRGEEIDPEVRAKIKLNKALTGHWSDRLSKMKSEIGDESTEEAPTDADTIIATVGGKRNAASLVKVYDRQVEEMQKDLDEQKKSTEKAKAVYDKAVEDVKEAEKEGDSQKKLDAQKALKEAENQYKNEQQQEKFMGTILSESKAKRDSYNDSIESANVDESNQRVKAAEAERDKIDEQIKEANEKKKGWLDENGRVKKGHNKQVENVNKEIQALEEQNKQKEDEIEKNKGKILTADEIFSLDPVTRARMMKDENQQFYSEAQQKEIEKLKNDLLDKDADALQKIQDIALLTQRVKQSKDAYRRLSQSPDAAASALESQRYLAANAAYGLINQRNAEIAADVINKIDEGSSENSKISDDDHNNGVYKILRQFNPEILDILDHDDMIPQHKQQLADAKSWRSITSDIDAVISNSNNDDIWKDNLRRNIGNVVESARTQEDVMKTLEKIVDDTDGSDASKDVEYVLKGLENLGHQRDATTLENRKQRREREAAENKKKEEAQQKVKAEAEAAAQKAADESKAKEEKEKKEGNNNIPSSSNIAPTMQSEEPKVDMKAKADTASIKEIADATGRTVEEVNRAAAELRTELKKKEFEGWEAPSTAIGNTADIIVRDFFAGELKDHYPNITDAVMKHFLKQLEAFKKELDNKGIHIVSKEVMAHGVMEAVGDDGEVHKINVAGTLDLFGYDDKGTYYIFDMKTTRQHSKYKLLDAKNKWSRQVSTYADLLYQTYGIKVDEDNLRIIPINVSYPTPKGEGKYLDPNGPKYDVDKETGQLKMTDSKGNTKDFIQDKTKDFEMRSTKLKDQFQTGYTHVEISWDSLTSTDQDTANFNKEVKDPEKVEEPKSTKEAINKIVNDTKKFTMSEDENYYYIKNKETGEETRWARVTSVIAADRIEARVMPTNAELYNHLMGNTSSEAEKRAKEEDTENAQPAQNITMDGSNLQRPKEEGLGDVDHSKAELTGISSSSFNADRLMSDEDKEDKVDVGEMWTGDTKNAHKAKVEIKKEGNKITFTADGKAMSLEVTPNEYESSNKESTSKESLLNFTLGKGSNKEVSYKVTPHEKIKKNGIKEITFESDVTYIKGAPKGKKEGDPRHLEDGKGFIVIDSSDIDFAEYSKDTRHIDGTSLSEEGMKEEIEESKQIIKNLLTPILNPKIGPQYNVKKIIELPNGKCVVEFNDANHTRIQMKRNPLTGDVESSQHKEDNTTEESKDNGVFNATSIEKKDDGWYFNGNFAGTNETTQVKAKENFNIDTALDRQKEAREAELAAFGVDTENKNIVPVDDEHVMVKSESLEDQYNDAKNSGIETSIADGPKAGNSDRENTVGEEKINKDDNTLGGNAMSRYKTYDLTHNRRLVKKQGADPNDSMNQYFAWIDAAGINQQNIIDHELPMIMKLNPNLKFKFMTVRPEDNATNDMAMSRSLLLVVDYDNSINKGITDIHNKDNGGVVESEGKKYLIVGTASYGKKNPTKMKWYDILFGNNLGKEKGGPGPGLMLRGRANYFKNHPNERFYVNDDITTEMVPYSHIPGYLVKQNLNDKTNGTPRSVVELVRDRNPLHIPLEDLAWGIQERKQFLAINANVDEIMEPNDKEKNMGTAFVLIPACNGKYMPSPIKPLMYSEMKEGSLKTKIDALLNNLMDTDYKKRYVAAIELGNILYLDKDKNFFLLKKHVNEVAIIKDGENTRGKYGSYNLDNASDRQAFMDDVKNKMNPRINITAKVLSNTKRIMEYAEAGALNTDAAMLALAGSSYSVYPVDWDGKMVKPSTPSHNIPSSSESSFRNDGKSQVILNHQFYVKDGDNYFLEGELVTDADTIKQLDYNHKVLSNGMIPVKREGTNDFYIISAGNNPEVIKIDANTKEVKVLDKKQAVEIIKKEEEKKLAEQREKEAQKKLKKEKENQEKAKNGEAEITDKEDVDLDLKDEDYDVDPDTGEIIQRPDNTQASIKEKNTSEDNHKEEKPKEEKGESDAESESNNQEVNPTLIVPRKGSTQKFIDICKGKKYQRRIAIIISKKWSDAPKSMKALEKFLREKDIEVDNIGTSQADIEAWIKTIEDCR